MRLEFSGKKKEKKKKQKKSANFEVFLQRSMENKTGKKKKIKQQQKKTQKGEGEMKDGGSS